MAFLEGALAVARHQVFQANIMHWRIPCFYNILPRYHAPAVYECLCLATQISCSGKMRLGPKTAANFGPKIKTALFAEETAGCKRGAPILETRKRLLHGMNFYCIGLAFAARRNSKVSLSHLSIRLLEASCPHSHIHTQTEYTQLTSKLKKNMLFLWFTIFSKINEQNNWLTAKIVVYWVR